MPSYGQLNIDLKYQFKTQLAGWDAEFLYTYKKGNGNTYNNPKYVFNKENLSLFNIYYQLFFLKFIGGNKFFVLSPFVQIHFIVNNKNNYDFSNRWFWLIGYAFN
ncbi:hypothetical protein [Hydrotalea sp.]|uniref:hypothetical protein n=1 Tax=Hydrotalea sp. TaxID=2881279 RepID=UPI00262D451E|nr:hypothetical protein [Hydrotalea sp.]